MQDGLIDDVTTGAQAHAIATFLHGASTKQFTQDGVGGNVAAVAFYQRGEAGRFALQRQI